MNTTIVGLVGVGVEGVKGRFGWLWGVDGWFLVVVVVVEYGSLVLGVHLVHLVVCGRLD